MNRIIRVSIWQDQSKRSRPEQSKQSGATGGFPFDQRPGGEHSLLLLSSPLQRINCHMREMYLQNGVNGDPGGANQKGF